MIKTIIGKRGKGKTTLIHNLILTEEADKTFILDPSKECNIFKTKDVFTFNDIKRPSYFCSLVWEYANKRKKTLVIFDEIHNYGKNCDPINYLYRMGRHWNIEIIAASHRFVDMPMITQSQTERYYVFKVTGRADKRWLKDELPDEHIYQISHLDNFKYVILEL